MAPDNTTGRNTPKDSSPGGGGRSRSLPGWLPLALLRDRPGGGGSAFSALGLREAACDCSDGGGKTLVW